MYLLNIKTTTFWALS